MSQNDKVNQPESDLDNLLTEALKDFEQSDEKTTQKAAACQEEPELWNEEFFLEQSKVIAEKMNKAFSAEDNELSHDGINKDFKKMAEAAALALQEGTASAEATQRYADSISEALRGLKEGAENLHAPISDADINSMFSGLNTTEINENDSNPFVPFMQGMMQSLFSAEIMLPSVKELLEKYPTYLEENADKISEEDKQRYVKQKELFEELCRDLESEKAEDSTDVKQKRFKKILNNMQKLHDYGKPPDELTEGSDGLPQLSDNSQCPLMK